MCLFCASTRSGDSNANGLMSGYQCLNRVLGYKFSATTSEYGSGYGNGETQNGFKALSATQEGAAEAIFAEIASFTGLTFVEVTGSGYADMRLAQSNVPPTAWAYLPGGNNGGDVWFNGRGTYANPIRGNYAFETLMHEIGHALGLKHASENGSYGAISGDVDSLEYTVMTYRSYIGASATAAYSNDRSSYPQTMMMYDILTLQHMYGANYGTRSGDSVYSWDDETGEMSVNGVGQGAPSGNRIFATVWDGGGTDTFDLSNYDGGISVDIRPGSWSTVSGAQVARLSYDGAHLAAGNIATALLNDDDERSLIENVIGGDGADFIQGNSARNLLRGGAGDDTLNGGGGADLIYGNQGRDLIMVYDGACTVFGGQNDDVIDGTTDILSSAQLIYGNLGDDRLLGGGGRDTIYGGQGGDAIYGNAGADILLGNRGADSLWGGQGNDVLRGDEGADLLVGGAGGDRFVFGAGSGADRIDGFSMSEGDRLDLQGQTYAISSTTNGSALLTLSGTGTVTLAGIAASSVGAGFFA